LLPFTSVCFKIVSGVFLKLLHFLKLWYYSIIILIGVSFNFVNFELKPPNKILMVLNKLSTGTVPVHKGE